jgi:hypothetical protein
MSQSPWTTILSRVTREEAENIDDLLRPHDPRARRMGRDLFPTGVDRVPFTPAFRRDETVVVGVRVTQPREDYADFAVQLSAFALEKDVEIVVLSHLDYAGLERFGFRCERITGETPEAREACERQVAAFWNLEVVI